MSTARLGSLCVFCGSRVGRDPRHRRTAEALGDAMAQRGLRLVYGGGSVGLMGIVADRVLASGGHVTGVIPRVLARAELLHDGLSELHVVETMHERKALMSSLSDAFVALPGGFGTFEEILEVITWAQLRIQTKPIAFLDEDYWAPLLGMFDRAVEEGFISAGQRTLFRTARDVSALFAILDDSAPVRDVDLTTRYDPPLFGAEP